MVLSADPDQKFLYLNAWIPGLLNVFRRNAEDGRLQWVGLEEDRDGVNLGDVRDIALSPDGVYLSRVWETGFLLST